MADPTKTTEEIKLDAENPEDLKTRNVESAKLEQNVAAQPTPITNDDAKAETTATPDAAPVTEQSAVSTTESVSSSPTPVTAGDTTVASPSTEADSTTGETPVTIGTNEEAATTSHDTAPVTQPVNVATPLTAQPVSTQPSPAPSATSKDKKLEASLLSRINDSKAELEKFPETLKEYEEKLKKADADLKEAEATRATQANIHDSSIEARRGAAVDYDRTITEGKAVYSETDNAGRRNLYAQADAAKDKIDETSRQVNQTYDRMKGAEINVENLRKNRDNIANSLNNIQENMRRHSDSIKQAERKLQELSSTANITPAVVPLPVLGSQPVAATPGETPQSPVAPTSTPIGTQPVSPPPSPDTSTMTQAPAEPALTTGPVAQEPLGPPPASMGPPPEPPQASSDTSPVVSAAPEATSASAPIVQESIVPQPVSPQPASPSPGAGALVSVGPAPQPAPVTTTNVTPGKPQPKSNNFYERLGVPHNASQDDIKKAYKAFSLVGHPDKDKSPDATENFQKVSEANQVLSDPITRKAYDAELAQAAKLQQPAIAPTAPTPTAATQIAQPMQPSPPHLRIDGLPAEIIRPATNQDRQVALQKASANDIPKESKFIKYGKAIGWAFLDALVASVCPISQQTGKVITPSLIAKFFAAAAEDKKNLKGMFDFLENQAPPFKKIGTQHGYDSNGNPMTTWIYSGGNPATNISVSREKIGASNPESKEMFLQCVDKYAEVTGKVNNGKINLYISGDKNALQGLQETIDNNPKLSKFRDMNGLPKAGVTPPTVTPPTPPPTPQQQQSTAMVPSGPGR